MKDSPSRACPNCGAHLAAEEPCPACALAGAFATLGFDAPPAPAPAFSPLDLPSTFRHYRVDSEIAAGGMGMVYEAWDTQLGRRVALKMLRQVFFATEAERLRFQREAELASRLDHPNIVPIYEVGIHDGQPYFTMKLVRGETLAARLTGGPIAPRAVALLMLNIARAVHHAHQRGVIHRDLKPANVLLDEEGQPWLTDFGVAKCLETDSSLTITRAIIGTPEYMSPEQAAGRTSEITMASDIWALGVMLYQMLTGRLPFYGESPTAILARVASGEPPARGTVHGPIDRDQDLETLCLRCLEKDPDRRLASAGELADELTRWLNGDPIRARRITALERGGKWMLRHPYRTVFIGVFAVVLVGAVAGITWQWRRATANEQRALASAAAERRTSNSAMLAQALSAREHHDFGQARRLLNGISPDRRGFDWRLLDRLCRGDDVRARQLGPGPGDEPQCLALTPDRQTLAILSADGYLHHHNLQGQPVAPPRTLPPLPQGPSTRHYRGLTFSPDGQRMAYACGDVLQVLDARTFAVLYEETSRLPQCGWLDNDRLLYGFNGSITAPPWPNAGAWILNFHGIATAGRDVPRTSFPRLCAPLAVSPDRRFFVLHRVIAEPTSWARSLHLYQADGDLSTIPKALYTMPGRDYPGTIAFSRSGRYLAFSAGPTLRQTARVLEVASGQMLLDHTFRFPIHALAMDGDEQRLALVGGDSVVRLYDFTRAAPPGEPTNTYDDEVDPVRRQPVDGRGAHAPPRDLLTRTAQDGRARFYLGHEKQVLDITFDANGSLVSAGADGTLRLWPASAPRPFIRLGYMATGYPRDHPAACVDGLRVLYSDRDSTRLCDVPRSRGAGSNHVETLAYFQTPLAVLMDGRVLTQDQASTEVVIWRIVDGQLREEKRISAKFGRSHNGRTRRGVLSRDEQRLAGAMDGMLFSVDLGRGILHWSGDLGDTVSRHANHDLSPDGEWIATSDFGPRVTLHRFAQPETIVATLGGAARDYDTAVAFSRDGQRLFTGNEDGRIRVWDTATWQERPDLGWPAHRSAVTALAVSHDGTLIATSGDETLKLFPAEPEPGEPYRRERLSFHLDQPANWIQFARDEQGRDRALLHSVPGGTLQIWETDVTGKPGTQPVK